jgi:hypothetical protein
MKKVIMFLGIMMVSYCSFSQTKSTTPKFSYKVGLVTGLPVDTYGDGYRINVGSTLLNACYKNSKFSKKISLTGEIGYIGFTNQLDEKFAQIPVMAGLKYPINDMFYFGTCAGVTFYNKKSAGDQNFIYSPYVGIQVKRISADLRYWNTVKSNNVAMKTVGLTFSYSL